MPNLQEISNWFDDFILMDALERASKLDTIPDRELAEELKSLLEADNAANRAGFLPAPAH